MTQPLNQNKMESAVEWLAKELYEKFEMRGDGILYDEILDQAKDMEKEQIENAFYKGIQEQTARVLINAEKTTPEQYYNETFKQ